MVNVIASPKKGPLPRSAIDCNQVSTFFDRASKPTNLSLNPLATIPAESMIDVVTIALTPATAATAKASHMVLADNSVRTGVPPLSWTPECRVV